MADAWRAAIAPTVLSLSKNNLLPYKFLTPLNFVRLIIRSPSLSLVASRLPRNRIMSAAKDGDKRVERIAASIRPIPDWPIKGILFRDITTLLLDPQAFQDTIDIFVERYKGYDLTAVAGIEARGFIFGPPIALGLGIKFVTLRKPKKLPGETISEEYALEYGTDKIEMHKGAVGPGDKVLLVDDLVATGGTLGAGIRLLERAGAEVTECACVIELPDLKGRERLGGKPLFVVVEYDGH